jgi:hypothetical protein
MVNELPETDQASALLMLQGIVGMMGKKDKK